ncbi:putative membrane protein [Halobellus limi]|nr:putative membrane protein [Halobellus limi]
MSKDRDGSHGTAERSPDAVTSRPTVAGTSWLVVYLKGICMGAADAVPGVSGGTIALVTGIYERLIAAITAVSPARIRAVLFGFLPGRREDAVDALRAVDAGFLLVLGAGILTAIVTITRVVHVGIQDFPVLTFGFFFGLIAASAWVLFSEVAVDTLPRAAAAVAGFVLAFVVSGQAAATLGDGLPVTVAAGAIAVSAMILPGISGSLLLIILGQYEYMTGTLSAFVDALLALATGGPTAPIWEHGAVVVAFVAGAFVGLFTIAHAVRAALERARTATLAFLVALIVGALRAPVARTGGQLAELGRSWTPTAIAAFVAAAVVGAVLVVLLDHYTGIGEIDGDA